MAATQPTLLKYLAGCLHRPWWAPWVIPSTPLSHYLDQPLLLMLLLVVVVLVV
jgi:hypothetical protein